DVVSRDKLFALLEGRQCLEAVVHMGAISSTTGKDADLLVAVNVTLMTGLWHGCATHRTPLMHASAAATSRAGEHGFDDEDRLEALPKLRPLNAYGWSKCYFDRRVAM